LSAILLFETLRSDPPAISSAICLNCLAILSMTLSLLVELKTLLGHKYDRQ
jgi:hypothetical protein